MGFRAWLVLGVGSSELGPSLIHGAVFGQILNAATFHLRGRVLTLSPGSEVLAGIFGLCLTVVRREGSWCLPSHGFVDWFG